MYVIKSHCDLSVLAASLMDFPKKNWIEGWVGELRSIQKKLILRILLTLQSP